MIRMVFSDIHREQLDDSMHLAQSTSVPQGCVLFLLPPEQDGAAIPTSTTEHIQHQFRNNTNQQLKLNESYFLT